jgi:hypothetical protein
VDGVGQWLATTWPSYGLPCGSGKMPNEILKMNFQKLKRPTKSGEGPAKYGGQTSDFDKSKQQLQTWRWVQTTYIFL